MYSFSRNQRQTITPYGIDIVGTEGRIAIRESVGTTMFIHKGQHKTPAEAWEPVHLSAEDLDEQGNPRDKGSIRLLLQRLMLRDLIAAIEEDRDPFASGRDGRDCLEMIHATWESHRQKARVSMPLTPTRTPPLKGGKEILNDGIRCVSSVVRNGCFSK